MAPLPPSLHHKHTGLESKRELMSEFVEGEFDPNDQKMYKLLGLDALDEKKARVNPDDFKVPGVRSRVCVWMCVLVCGVSRGLIGLLGGIVLTESRSSSSTPFPDVGLISAPPHLLKPRTGLPRGSGARGG